MDLKTVVLVVGVMFFAGCAPKTTFVAKVQPDMCNAVFCNVGKVPK